ncbi:MAG: ATP-binding protein, partial [Cyanobacteria bacterium J06632_3]
LRHVLQDVLEIEASQFQDKGLKLIRPDFREPVMIQVDHSRFKQVLLNVLSNAIKFTDEGAISIKVISDESAENNSVMAVNSPLADMFLPPGPWMMIQITDSGIGIEPQNLSKLFKPFVMIDGSHTRPYEGTGLGLAISQNFMRLMQGDIHITSEGSGKGTTVTIVVPRAVKQESDLREAKPALMPEVAIDDSQQVAQSIASDVGVAAESSVADNHKTNHKTAMSSAERPSAEISPAKVSSGHQP